MRLEVVLEEAGVKFCTSGHHHCRPGWIQLDCPFCGKDSQRFHLGFNLSSAYFNCWKCGPHGMVSVLRELGLRTGEALAVRRDLERDFDAYVPPVRQGLREPKGRGPLQKAHRRYLEGRGFDPDKLAQDWQIEGLGLVPGLAWRIYIPIVFRGQRVSWTTRAIGSEVEQRYLSASAAQEAVNHKHTVYGLDFCRHSVVVVEGPIDAWAIGFGAGALFGTAFLTPQVRALCQIPLRFVCFDSSPDAQARACKLCRALAPFPGRTVNVELDAKDPGCAPAKELHRLRRLARLDT